MHKFIRKKSSQVPSGNESLDLSTLAFAIVPYTDFGDGEMETDDIEAEEDIDVNLNNSPVADVDDSF